MAGYYYYISCVGKCQFFSDNAANNYGKFTFKSIDYNSMFKIEY